jgi:hypothetical protein
VGFTGQTEYNRKMDPAFAGMPADNGPHDDYDAVLEEDIGFGLGVVKGSVTDAGTLLGGGIKLPDAQADIFRGVTMYTPKEGAYPFVSGGASLKQGEVASIRRKGRIWVQTDGESNTLDTTVYITTAGKFTSTAGTNATATGAVFAFIDSARGIAILDVNLPQ